MASVAALCAAMTVWWLVPDGSSGLGRLRATSAGGCRGGGARRAADRDDRRWWSIAGLCAVGAVVGSGVVAGPGAAAVVLALGQVGGCVAWVSRARSGRRTRARRRTEVAHAGELIASLLRVGRIPGDALAEAAQDAPVLVRAAAEVEAGGEPAAALRHAVVAPGLEGLAELSAAWELSVRTGASLAPALDAAASRLASEEEVGRTVEAELAAARLAGRVLAFLPLVGLALSFVIGGNPFSFLTGGVLGWLCLNVGAALACAGVLWIEAVAARAGGR